MIRHSWTPLVALGLVALSLACLTASVADARAQTIELSFAPAFTRAESLGNFDFGFSVEADDASGSTLNLTMVVPIEIDRGWGVAPAVTLHTKSWMSHEVTYSYTHADLIFDFSRVTYALYLGDDRIASGTVNSTAPYVERLVVRDVGYGLVANLRSRDARIQPYVVAGPRLVAYRFKHGGHSNSSFFKRIGLGSVGSIIGGVRAARTDPLDGGTIYRWGVAYGGGVRVGLTRTLGLKLDLRQTVIGTPDFALLEPQELIDNYPASQVTQDDKVIRRFGVTAGLTFNF